MQMWNVLAHGLAWHGMLWHGAARLSSTLWYGTTARHGPTRRSTAQHGAARHGMTDICFLVVATQRACLRH
jgi:hypothetical protein